MGGLQVSEEARVGMASATVLIVSDDVQAGQLWANTLVHAGLEAVLVHSSAEALQRWEQGSFDLTVVDVCAQLDGLDLCRMLRACAANPILLLCSHNDEAHSVAAYAAGADECVPKPVSASLLLAKIRAWLRHRWTVRAESLLPLEAGGVRLEPSARQLSTAEGAAVQLSALEFRLLYLLMSHPGKVLPPDLLVPGVWGPGGGGDGRLVQHIVHHLRLKLELDLHRPRTIRTVAGQGYAFVA